MGRQRCPLRCCFQPRSQACCCSIFTLRPYPTPHALTQSCPHKPPFPLLITKARINLVTGQEGESCLRTFDCGPGLCCARHFWTKICKPVPLEGQVCSRRAHKDTAQAPEIFQRCDCGPGLSRRSQATIGLCRGGWASFTSILGFSVFPLDVVKDVLLTIHGQRLSSNSSDSQGTDCVFVDCEAFF